MNWPAAPKKTSMPRQFPSGEGYAVLPGTGHGTGAGSVPARKEEWDVRTNRMSIASRTAPGIYTPGSGYRRRQRARLVEGLLYAAPFLVGFLLLTALPMLASIYLSFASYDSLRPPKWIGMANYAQLVQDSVLDRALLNTVVYAGLSVPLNVGLSLLVAILLNQRVRWVAAWRSIYYLPSITPVVAYALLWRWMLSKDFGIINAGLGLIGISPIDWLGDANWILVAYVLSGLWTIGGTMIINLAGLQSVPTELYDAARVDGAGRVRIFTAITIPMLSPVLFYNVIMGIVGAMQSFSFFYIFSQRTGTYGATDIGIVYMTYLYRMGWQFFRMGYASAMAWLLFAIILVLTLLVVMTSRRWVYYEGEWLNKS
jgi:multiple sugar transport system permease protein